MVGVLGPQDRFKLNQVKMEGALIINTTSHSTDWGKQFSPFVLGPVALYGGRRALNVENAWQYSKVYEEHVDSSGEPSEAYWKWAEAGWASKRAIRYPMGKGSVALYSYWDGEHLGYVEARKKIYAPLYIKAVVPQPAFKQLKERFQKGEKIYLWDFDGYDYLEKGRTLGDVLNDPKMKMGHAFIIAMLLTLSKEEILDLLEIEG